MIITISGNLGSGKSTICDYLSKKYGFSVYSTGAMHREIAKNMGLTTLELNELMKNDHSYDNAIDNEIVRLSEQKSGEQVIFDSRLAFHFAKGAFKVFAVINPVEAAKRVHNSRRGNVERYGSLEETMQKLSERSRVENLRFKEIYGIDNLNLSNYDLVIDTSWESVDHLAETVMRRAEMWEQGLTKGGTSFLLSPKSLYPTRGVKGLSEQEIDKYMEENTEGSALPPVCVTEYEGYFYIISGHRKALAAQLTGHSFVEAALVKNDESVPLSMPGNLMKELQRIGAGALSDFESIGGFSYKSTPGTYQGGSI